MGQLKQSGTSGRRLQGFTLIGIAVTITVASTGSFARSFATVDKSTMAESRFVKLDGARIHYVNYGKGNEALVLIHGWTMNADNWRDNVADFAKRNRVIVIELPGHGESDKPAYAKTSGQERFKYSMDLFARAVAAVMRDAKVRRAVLVGHSMGTPVARQFYRKYPEKTLAIVIVDGPLRPFGDKAFFDGLLAGLRGPTYKEVAGQMLNQLSGPNLSAEARERIKAANLNTPQYVLVSAMESMADPAIWGDDQLNVPVLTLIAKTGFFPANIEQIDREIASNMEFHMWEGVGHFIMMEKPREFSAQVIAWLNKTGLLKKN